MEKLLFYLPGINECNKDDEHKRVISAAVLQIRDDIYNRKLAVDEKLAWEYISKAIGFVVPAPLCRIDVSVYSDMDLRQILLPPQLRIVDIQRVLAERGINYMVSGLEVGLKNVSFDPSLGKSPQEWLREEVMRDYTTKGGNYAKAMDYISAGAGAYGLITDEFFERYKSQFSKLSLEKTEGGWRVPIWPQNYDNFQKVVKEMRTRGEDLPLFVNGWSVYKVGEQEAPDLSPLVGRSIRPQPLAAYPGWANYPNDPTGRFIHTEPWVKTLNGRLFGFWMDRDAFFKAYEGALNLPSIGIVGPDGKSYDPFTFR